MTLIVGLRGANGVVLASDSQGTHADLKRPVQKLFKAKCGLIWGTAGPLGGAQELFTEFEKLDLPLNPRREDAKKAIANAIKVSAARLDLNQESTRFEGLFAWFDGLDRRHYLLLARQDGRTEFMTPYGAIGSGGSLGFFGFSRSAFLDYKTLQLEQTKMLVYMVAADAIEASAKGVDGPVQMAVVSNDTSAVLRKDEVQQVQETTAAYQLHQVDFLKRVEAPAKSGSSGIVPGERGD